MQEEARKARNTARIGELRPDLQAKFRAVLDDLEGHGFRPRIQDAYRTQDEQFKLFRAGYSRTKSSLHTKRAAADILDDDAKDPASPSRMFTLLLAASAEAHDLTTGIRWGLPHNLRERIDRLIKSAAWTDWYKRGWDPCHVEPSPALRKRLGI